jgi:multidrug efflux pump subunit AcrA (membrane-fusion protein)
VFRKKWFWIVLVLIVAAGGAGAAFARRGEQGITVTVESIQKRDLDAIVSASGKIQPKKTVNISAQTMGRVTRLSVEEGDRVKAGQFLLQIDPVTAEAAVRRDVAAVAGAQTILEQSRCPCRAHGPTSSSRRRHEAPAGAVELGPDHARVARARQSEVEMRESDLHAREQEIKNRETQLNQQRAGLASSAAHAGAGAIRCAVRRHRHPAQHRGR